MTRPTNFVLFAAIVWFLESGSVAFGQSVGAPDGEVPTWLQWGTVKVHPSASYDYSYSEGAEATPGNPSNSSVQSVALGFLADLSSRWSADYAPTWKYSSNPQFPNSLDQTAALNGGATVGDCALTLAEGYSSTSTPLIETGAQTHQESFSSQLAAAQRLTDTLALNTSLGQTIESANVASEGVHIPQTADWTGSGNLAYALSSSLNASLGMSGSFVNEPTSTRLVGTTIVEGKVQVVTASLTGGFGWHAADRKNSLTLQGGASRQEYLQGGSGGPASPTFSVALSHKPYDNTTLSVSAGESENFSYLTGQTDIAKNVQFSLEQRLLGHFELNVGVGGTEAHYVASTAGSIPSRNDRTYFYNASLGLAQFLRRGAISVSYSRTGNNSNVPGFSQSPQQFDLRIGWSY